MQRREFLGKSAKFSMAFFGLNALNLSAAENSRSNLDKNSAKNLSKNSANLAENSSKNSANLAENSSKGTKMQYLTLNNGVKMPILGYGTSRMSGKEAQRAIGEAIKVGYRLIDTAQMYGNEAQVGTAVAQSGVKRDEFFITTKLSSDMSYDETLRSFDESMKRLGLDFLDLLLIHSPYTQAPAMYQAMEKLYKQGRIRALGISNFKPSVYENFVKNCEIIPAVNQCQTHIFHQQKPLRQTMARHGTILESWSPFVAGRSDFFSNPALQKIAANYGKSVAQIALRFLIEQNIIVIPKSANSQRMCENFAVFDFALKDEDTKALIAMDTGKSAFGWD